MKKIHPIYFITNKTFNTPNQFSIFIEKMVIKDNITYIDAIISYCDQNDIDLEQVPLMINQKIKDKIRMEAEENNLMQSISTSHELI